MQLGKAGAPEAWQARCSRVPHTRASAGALGLLPALHQFLKPLCQHMPQQLHRAASTRFLHLPPSACCRHGVHRAFGWSGREHLTGPRGALQHSRPCISGAAGSTRVHGAAATRTCRAGEAYRYSGRPLPCLQTCLPPPPEPAGAPFIPAIRHPMAPPL